MAVTTHDWFDWTSLIFTVSGTLITLYALWRTFREAKAAKGAAEAARESAQAATGAISNRVTIADLASLRAVLGATIFLIESGKLEVAIYEIRNLRQRVSELRERKGSPIPRDEVQAVVADLAQLQESLEMQVFGSSSDHVAVPVVSKLLSAHIDRLAGWAEQLRFQEQ